MFALLRLVGLIPMSPSICVNFFFVMGLKTERRVSMVLALQLPNDIVHTKLAVTLY